MARKQTRRSISINRGLFDKAKAAASSAGVPLSRYTEAALDVVAGRADTMAAALAAPPIPWTSSVQPAAE